MDGISSAAAVKILLLLLLLFHLIIIPLLLQLMSCGALTMESDVLGITNPNKLRQTVSELAFRGSSLSFHPLIS